VLDATDVSELQLLAKPRKFSPNIRELDLIPLQSFDKESPRLPVPFLLEPTSKIDKLASVRSLDL